MKSYNTLNDFENGLVSLKAMMQDQDEEAKLCIFNGSARIVGATSPPPRGLPYALNCSVAGDYLLYGSWVKARSVEFWVYLGSTTEEIIDPVIGNDIDVNAGTLQYTDWDNAYVDAVDTDTIGASAWHHVVITSSTDVILPSGFNLGKGDIQVAGLRWWKDELSLQEIQQLENGSVGEVEQNNVMILNLPNLTDLSGNGNNATNNGADIIASGRNGGNCLDFISGNNDYVDCGNLGTIKALELWINPDNVTQSILDCDGGSHKITVAAGTITATGFTSFYVDSILSGTLFPKSWQHLVALDSSGFSASALTLGKEGANYLDARVDIVRAYDREFTAMEANVNLHRQRRGLL